MVTSGTYANEEMAGDEEISGKPSLKGYIKCFIGAAEKADAADEAAFMPNTTDAEGAYQFEIPVSGLDEGINYAAWSKKRNLV